MAFSGETGKVNYELIRRRSSQRPNYVINRDGSNYQNRSYSDGVSHQMHSSLRMGDEGEVRELLSSPDPYSDQARLTEDIHVGRRDNLQLASYPDEVSRASIVDP